MSKNSEDIFPTKSISFQNKTKRSLPKLHSKYHKFLSISLFTLKQGLILEPRLPETHDVAYADLYSFTALPLPQLRNVWITDANQASAKLPTASPAGVSQCTHDDASKSLGLIFITQTTQPQKPGSILRLKYLLMDVWLEAVLAGSWQRRCLSLMIRNRAA